MVSLEKSVGVGEAEGEGESSASEVAGLGDGAALPNERLTSKSAAASPARIWMRNMRDIVSNRFVLNLAA